MKDGEKLFQELHRNITRTTGFDGLMRIRTSRGNNNDNPSNNNTDNNKAERLFN